MYRMEYDSVGGVAVLLRRWSLGGRKGRSAFRRWQTLQAVRMYAIGSGKEVAWKWGGMDRMLKRMGINAVVKS